MSKNETDDLLNDLANDIQTEKQKPQQQQVTQQVQQQQVTPPQQPQGQEAPPNKTESIAQIVVGLGFMAGGIFAFVADSIGWGIGL